MTMKKIVVFLFVGCLFALGFISCHPDYTHYTYYTYINHTASIITIECYYGDAPFDEVANPDDLYKTLTILPGEENTVVFGGRTFSEPFGWLNTSAVYLLVKNEQVKVFERGATNNLLKEKVYTLTSASEYRRYYEYSFTDDYFKKGKPME